MDNKQKNSLDITLLLLLFLGSAAVLTFEITLTRIFSVAQFYHFAFMVVSIALLGFGASGSLLSVYPSILKKNLSWTLTGLTILASLSIFVSYFITNKFPFDSFSIAWDYTQILILILHYIILALPFFFTGLSVGILLASFPRSAGQVYAYNLTGSAVGCITAVIAPRLFGGEGTVILSVLMGGMASLTGLIGILRSKNNQSKGNYFILYGFTAIIIVFLSCFDLIGRLAGKSHDNWLSLNISPYKSLSYALQYPDAQIKSSRWNSFSRVDVVSSKAIRSIPGLSYQYLDTLPEQEGLFVDGDNLRPLILSGSRFDFYEYLPSSVVFTLRPASKTLVLGSNSGIEILTALNLGANSVTAVEVNQEIIQAANNIYKNNQVISIPETERSFLIRNTEKYDVIILPLNVNYHPVRSGAYSLSEDYRYTVESFQEVLNNLHEDGYFLVTRWLQYPPSEFLRTFTIAITALEKSNINPENNIVALRGYNTGTLIIKKSGFENTELKSIREFSNDLKFDLVYAPDIDENEVNQFNILLDPSYYNSFIGLIRSKPRENFYIGYPYDVSPSWDDKPFFSNYFKWSQANQIFSELGKTWQPFGGAGYFVIVALLVLAILTAFLLILLPLIIFHARQEEDKIENQQKDFRIKRKYLYFFVYFAFLGLAFLFVEIPLIQRFILYLGHPSYALAAILFTILFFSGLGSRFSSKIPLLWAIGVLVFLLVLQNFYFSKIFSVTLGLNLSLRIFITIIILAPLGFFMGIPFPSGISKATWIEPNPALTSWFWGINGSISVVSSILAALLALSLGFSWVFRLGALFYFGAWLTARIAFNFQTVRSPRL